MSVQVKASVEDVCVGPGYSMARKVADFLSSSPSGVDDLLGRRRIVNHPLSVTVSSEGYPSNMASDECLSEHYCKAVHNCLHQPQKTVRPATPARLIPFVYQLSVPKPWARDGEFSTAIRARVNNDQH